MARPPKCAKPEARRMAETSGLEKDECVPPRKIRVQNMNVALTFTKPMVELYLPSALGEREGTLLIA